MHHLDKVLSQLQSDFHAGWAIPLTTAIAVDDINSDQNKLDAQLAILNILNAASNKFYKELNFSIITGEYLGDLTDADAKIVAIDTFIVSLVGFDVPGFPNMLVLYQQTFSEGFLQPIRNSLQQYKSLLKHVERHITHQPGSSMIFHELDENRTVRSRMVSVAITLAELFQINVTVSEIDHRLSYDKTTFKSLLLSLHQLNKPIFAGPDLELIKVKCEFLLYKLSFRLHQSKKKFDYVIDFNYKTVKLKEVTQFSKYNEIIKGHYGKNVAIPAFNSRSTAAKIKNGNAPGILNLDEYHALTKRYKDVERDIPALLDLKSKYSLLYDQLMVQPLSSFDKRAYDIAFCYIENNLFSLELKQKQINLSNWEAKLKSYTSRANSLNNSNFFPYYKIIKEFLDPEIERQFKQNDEKSLLIVKNLKEKYKENLDLLILNTEICEETEYLAFQADYQTALTDVTDSLGNTYKCFVSSAFVLPLEYTEYKDELETFKSRLTKYNAMYDVQELLQNDHKDIQVVKEEIEKTDKRHIEILSIFAALVMFVSGEIQIFSKLVDMRDAVTFTLFFAYGLGLFVLMIWFITRPKGLKRSSFSSMHYFIICIFFIGMVSGIWFVNKSDPPKTKSQVKIDSLNNAIQILRKQRTIDSLNAQRAKPVKTQSQPAGKKNAKNKRVRTKGKSGNSQAGLQPDSI
ncbi:hypothetical protein [Pedobacter sp. Leaf176]|uniref:hypothetical protein n=1 Tax=Pedobacter sp. Leaf176 TaxID=1736286 RepID=UPI0006F32F32|nr:hypothetical protein [Pedobacter sp. Leaf176]KQR65344.1 hypothetical protein ASF92_20660 [Pedobacter sp. Leaf176]